MGINAESEKKRILDNLNKDGIALSHIDLLFDAEEKLVFEKAQSFFDGMVSSDNFKHRFQRLKERNPIPRKNGKSFEFTHAEYLGKGIGLDDGGLIKSHINDIFLDLTEGYLGTSQLRIRNVLAWIHMQYPYPASHSMKWHRDTESEKLLKIWVYYSDVSDENGAAKYVKQSCKGKKNDHIWYNLENETRNWPGNSGYLNSAATAKIPSEDVVTAAGRRGTIVFVDSNGFHKGGYVKKGYRAITHAVYLKPTACQIANGTIGTFDYNSQEINYCDYNSEEFKALSKRQKRCLR